MFLFVGDLHLTARPKDAYRFDLFPFLRRYLKQHTTKATFLLGDLTDTKDNHPSSLVNRVVEELLSLPPPVYVLMGNHDYINPANPFFNFLNALDGVRFVSTPLIAHSVAMVPHCREQAVFDENCRQLADSGEKCRYLLVHQTFDGAIAETGARLSGLSPSAIDYFKPGVTTYAGDIHRPQRAGKVTYVGSPYNIRFGDDFEPRMVVVDRDDKPSNLYLDAPRKWALTIGAARDLESDKRLLKGDQVKITLEMAREETHEWRQQKTEVLAVCKKYGLEVFGLDLKVIGSVNKERVKLDEKVTLPDDVFDAFCKAEKVSSDVKRVGEKLLKDQHNE